MPSKSKEIIEPIETARRILDRAIQYDDGVVSKWMIGCMEASTVLNLFIEDIRKVDAILQEILGRLEGKGDRADDSK